LADETPNQTVAENGDSFLIVGLGASAGGIQALRTFFAQVPSDSGMAYVVILHMSPEARLPEETSVLEKLGSADEAIARGPDPNLTNR
jgi:chemotaxis response regulator CheB